MKIAILGYSGSGKSTLARTLGVRYHIPVLHMDMVQFEADWRERDRDEARAMVRDFMARPQWIIDGNYAPLCQAERLQEADRVIILCFSRLRCLWRAYRRYVTHRHTTRADMALNCHEKFDWAFLWWILYSGRTAEKWQPIWDALAKNPDKYILLTSQKQIDTFLCANFDSPPQVRTLNPE